MDGLRAWAEDVAIGIRFLTALPPFLRRPIDRGRAREIIRQRLRSREADFLRLVRDKVFAFDGSPYHPLLRHIGCEQGDVERMVEAEGIEGALLQLYRKGLYVTTPELRGTRPVVRGSLSYHPSPASFRNPSTVSHFTITSGGSGGAVRGQILNLSTLQESSVNVGLGYEVHGVSAESLATWDTPGPVMIAVALHVAKYFGRAPSRWFCHVDVKSPGFHRRFMTSWHILAWTGRMLGYRFPAPEQTPARDCRPVLRWLQEQLRAGKRPCVFTFPSSAVSLAQTAEEHGVDLRGALVLLSGEPLTRARSQAIARSGLDVASLYGASECGLIAHSCLSPSGVDDLHVQDDLHALVRLDGANSAALPEGALLLSSLRPSTRSILLNASLGDTGALEDRACGCPLDDIGWHRHIHTIRSFEKLTGAGMTFRDADIVRVLEEVLPQRLGGTALDYQLEETEGAAGESLLLLRIHPRLGAVDEKEAVEALLSGLASVSAVNELMTQVWRDWGIVRVRREAPEMTPGGKILHFRSAASRSTEPARPSSTTTSKSRG